MLAPGPRGRNGRSDAEHKPMPPQVREMPELELALLRRGLDQLSSGCERCGRCHRTLLIGERVYEYDSGSTVCELCRSSERDAPLSSHIVHGPEFGHTLRITDQRAAA